MKRLNIYSIAVLIYGMFLIDGFFVFVDSLDSLFFSAGYTKRSGFMMLAAVAGEYAVKGVDA